MSAICHVCRAHQGPRSLLRDHVSLWAESRYPEETELWTLRMEKMSWRIKSRRDFGPEQVAGKSRTKKSWI